MLEEPEQDEIGDDKHFRNVEPVLGGIAIIDVDRPRRRAGRKSMDYCVRNSHAFFQCGAVASATLTRCYFAAEEATNFWNRRSLPARAGKLRLRSANLDKFIAADLLVSGTAGLCVTAQTLDPIGATQE